MALETREAMGALTEKWRELGHDVGFGIGIAHGYAIAGRWKSCGTSAKSFSILSGVDWNPNQKHSSPKDLSNQTEMYGRFPDQDATLVQSPSCPPFV